MKKTKTHFIISIITSGFFLLLDQILKFLAQTNPETTKYIWKPWVGWKYFENHGIAFGIPLPQTMILAITPIIIIRIIFWWKKRKSKTILFYFGTTFIIAGAISNLIDRIFFSITIDYFRILTSIINIADVMIVVGAWLLVLNEIQCKSKIQNHK